MQLGNLSKVVAVAVSVVWAAGCSTTSTTTDSSDAMAQTDGQTQDGAAVSGTGSDGAMSGGSMSDSSMSSGGDSSMTKVDLGALANVFYFDFDKAVIQSSDLADLNAHAEYLAQNPGASVVLEGHADERGTREYNMALGERRAKAVARYLNVQGVASTQIETVSYGEERPAMVGHSEASWSKNRRVELSYNR